MVPLLPSLFTNREALKACLRHGDPATVQHDAVRAFARRLKADPDEIDRAAAEYERTTAPNPDAPTSDE